MLRQAKALEAAGDLREAAELLVLTSSLSRHGRITVVERLELMRDALQPLRRQDCSPGKEREATLPLEAGLLKDLWADQRIPGLSGQVTAQGAELAELFPGSF